MWLILFFLHNAFCVWLEMICHDPLAHEVSLLFLTAWSLQDHDILWPVVPHDIGVMFATDLRRSCLRIGVRHVEPLGGGTWDDGWHEWYVHVHVLLNWILLGPILYNIIIYILYIHIRFRCIFFASNCPPCNCLSLHSTLSTCLDATYARWNPSCRGFGREHQRVVLAVLPFIPLRPRPGRLGQDPLGPTSGFSSPRFCCAQHH